MSPELCPFAPCAPWVHCDHLCHTSWKAGLYTYICCFCERYEARIVASYQVHGPHDPGKKPAKLPAHAVALEEEVLGR